jgi:hypothetical protein
MKDMIQYTGYNTFYTDIEFNTYDIIQGMQCIGYNAYDALHRMQCNAWDTLHLSFDQSPTSFF